MHSNELSEDSLGIIGGNTDTIVTHAEQPLPLAALRREMTLRPPICGDRSECILNQVLVQHHNFVRTSADLRQIVARSLGFGLCDARQQGQDGLICTGVQ